MPCELRCGKEATVIIALMDDEEKVMMFTSRRCDDHKEGIHIKNVGRIG